MTSAASCRMHVARTVLAAGALLLGLAPAAAQVKKFGDWLVACDNARDCAAYSLRRGTYNAYLRIARGGTPAAEPAVTLAIMTDKPYRVTIASDGAVPLFPEGPTAAETIERDGFVRLTRELAPDALAAALRAATSLEVFHVEKPADWEDRKIDGISLAGALAALAWMDARQRRAGTETAAVKRGRRSVAAMPMPPALPGVAAARPGGAPAPKQAPPAILARGDAACGKEQKDGELMEIHRLGTDLLLYGFFCGAYSSASSLNNAFLIAPDARPEAARKPRFVLPPAVAALLARNELTGRKDSAYNAGFDARTQVLASFNPRRGAGDCGEFVEWVWTGRAFRVGSVHVMPECEGIPSSDWPAVYRTTRR